MVANAMLSIVSRVSSALKFKEGITAERVREHFETEVKLKERMPELVLSWSWSPNLSLATRADVNGGMTYVVSVNVATLEDLDAYLKHPQHMVRWFQLLLVADRVVLLTRSLYRDWLCVQEVVVIQGPMIEDKFVVDLDVSTGGSGGGTAGAAGAGGDTAAEADDTELPNQYVNHIV